MRELVSGYTKYFNLNMKNFDQYADRILEIRNAYKPSISKDLFKKYIHRKRWSCFFITVDDEISYIEILGDKLNYVDNFINYWNMPDRSILKVDFLYTAFPDKYIHGTFVLPRTFTNIVYEIPYEQKLDNQVLSMAKMSVCDYLYRFPIPNSEFLDDSKIKYKLNIYDVIPMEPLYNPEIIIDDKKYKLFKYCSTIRRSPNHKTYLKYCIFDTYREDHKTAISRTIRAGGIFSFERPNQPHLILYDGIKRHKRKFITNVIRYFARMRMCTELLVSDTELYEGAIKPEVIRYRFD